MPQYQVDSERIQASSAAVCTSITAIRQSVDQMYGNLNALQDAWRGGAATQFNALAAQWRAAQQQMEQSLESIQQALTQPRASTPTRNRRRRACSAQGEPTYGEGPTRGMRMGPSAADSPQRDGNAVGAAMT